MTRGIVAKTSENRGLRDYLHSSRILSSDSRNGIRNKRLDNLRESLADPCHKLARCVRAVSLGF